MKQNRTIKIATGSDFNTTYKIIIVRGANNLEGAEVSNAHSR